MNNVTPINNKFNIENYLKTKCETGLFIYCEVCPDGDYSSYISENMSDLELTYMIQCLQDHRDKTFKDKDD